MDASDLMLAETPAFIAQWLLSGAEVSGLGGKIAKFGADAGKVGVAVWTLATWEFRL